MKKILSTVVCFLFLASNYIFAEFSDTQYSWYRNSIETLQGDGLVDGIGGGKYGPELQTTRAEILTILLRASETELPEGSTGRCFDDVATNAWYHTYVCGAYNLGIAAGFGNGKFQPNSTITTLEALAFGMKAFDIDIDLDDGDEWYEPLREFADDNNILATHSYTLGTKITRGKAAELIVRLREYKKKNKALDYESTGCSVDVPTLGETNFITIDGRQREYILAVPSGYDNSKEYNLVVAFHGRTNSNSMVQGYMGLEGSRNSWSDGGGGRRGSRTPTVSTSDTIVAYPAGISTGKSFSWSEKESVTFYDALVQQISENYCINRNKVYVVGHSLGGWMTNKIACLRGEYLSGMSTVGSGGFNGNCTGPVSSLLYQNVDDQLSSYASGKSQEAIRLKVNECSGDLEDITIGSLTCKKYTNCSADNEVVWCEGYPTYGNDPHSWPTPNGGRDILEFLNN